MTTCHVRLLAGTVVALALTVASAAVHANLVPGLGAQAIASDRKGTLDSDCVTAFQIPIASCSVGIAGASATMQNAVDINVYASGGGMSFGIVQDTLYFYGTPVHPTDWITLRMSSFGTVAGPSNQNYATADFWIGGFVNIPAFGSSGMISTGTVSSLPDPGTTYDPGPGHTGQPFGITASTFSDGAHMEVAWSFPAAFVGPGGIDLRLILSCTASDSCTYSDPFTITLPAGMTFSSASGQFLAPVPEPTAFWLFAAGLACVARVQWKRRSPPFA